MAILFWLVPALLVTCVASAWAAWVGRGRPQLSERSEEAQARAQRRMAEALAKPHVGMRHSPAAPRERSTGVAVRRR
ncbi:MAG: hypothetical protein NVSMB48_10590 [Marmoricola sp.]